MNLGKCIGVGNTASTYEWEDGKVLKLFYQGYPMEAVENEYRNAMAIRDMAFAKPKAYEVISYEDRTGIVYDKVDGESLLDWVMRTGNLQESAIYMANLHKTIIHNTMDRQADSLNKNNPNNVTYYKDFLKYHLGNALLSSEEYNILLQKIDTLPDGNSLCHGDFHPGNILLEEGCPYVIDFMNICYGDSLYDVARTVFLVEYTPVPVDAKDRDQLLYFKKALTDLYLIQMNVTRDMIQDYLTVIAAARKGECPNE